MKLPYWLKGGLLATAYIAVIIFIKIICLKGEWCFGDFFFPFIFKPLVILDYILSENQIIVLGRNIIKTIFISWFFVGAVVGLAYGLFKKKN